MERLCYQHQPTGTATANSTEAGKLKALLAQAGGTGRLSQAHPQCLCQLCESTIPQICTLRPPVHRTCRSQNYFHGNLSLEGTRLL